ncbi:translocon-associated protein TRAP alpha subunit [Pelomyxa schiedti]|nr:translocon-associated protein TRAP alpha subunit [Pelomyxa schiedti]
MKATFLLALCVVALCGAAKDKQSKPEIIIRGNDDIATAMIFPDQPDQVFVAGEPVNLLVGVRNLGKNPITLLSLAASLHHPFNFKYIFQNYTRQNFAGVVVEPAEEASLSYSFTPDAMLEARAFNLFVDLRLFDAKANYSVTVYNTTLEIAEPPSLMNLQTLFVYLAGLSIAGLVAFVGYNIFKKLQQGTPTKAAHAKKPTSARHEWLSGTSAASHFQARKSTKKH